MKTLLPHQTIPCPWVYTVTVALIGVDLGLRPHHPHLTTICICPVLVISVVGVLLGDLDPSARVQVAWPGVGFLKVSLNVITRAMQVAAIAVAPPWRYDAALTRGLALAVPIHNSRLRLRRTNLYSSP